MANAVGNTTAAIALYTNTRFGLPTAASTGGITNPIARSPPTTHRILAAVPAERGIAP